MRILIIEDEKSLASAIAKMLKRIAYEADIFLDGESGFSAAQSDMYDGIILDLMLPGRNGLGACRV